MEDGPNGECFIELLEWTRSSADVSEPAADDKLEAIAPMSPSCARSISDRQSGSENGQTSDASLRRKV
jgi:hypothetical protein